MKRKPKRAKFEVGYDRRLAQWVGRGRTPVGSRYAIGFEKKPEAVAWMVGLARRQQPSQLFIKGRNGKIQDERTFGNDPRRTKG